MKSAPVDDAIGMILCHDAARIVVGQPKGPAFHKGRIIATHGIEFNHGGFCCGSAECPYPLGGFGK